VLKAVKKFLIFLKGPSEYWLYIFMC